MSLPFKMERLLTICKHRRKVHIIWLRRNGGPRCSAERPADDYLMIFDDDDMKIIYNTWQADVQSYMKDSTLAAHATPYPLATSAEARRDRGGQRMTPRAACETPT